MIAILFSLLAIYFGLGALFGVWFCAVGVWRIDLHARLGSWGFRVAIFPGVTALWPLLLLRVLRGREHPPEERTAHRLAARQNSSAS
jgi:hypothetical protein